MNFVVARFPEFEASEKDQKLANKNQKGRISGGSQWNCHRKLALSSPEMVGLSMLTMTTFGLVEFLGHSVVIFQANCARQIFITGPRLERKHLPGKFSHHCTCAKHWL